MSKYQKLFNLMFEEHGLTLLESEMQEIVSVVAESNLGQPTLYDHMEQKE